jgi:endonuclease/exonuclease/phosphatase family metal-dependent hydrolase
MLLRVMTYNIFDGGKGRESQILQVIRAVKPDVAILQEVTSVEFLDHLARELSMDAFFADGNIKKRVTLLSRSPIRWFKNYRPFPPIWRNVIDFCIEPIAGKTLRLIGIHTRSSLWIGFELWRWWEVKYVLRKLRLVPDEACLVVGDFNAIAPGDRVLLSTMPNWIKFMIRLQGNRLFHFTIQTFLGAGFVDCFRSLHPDEDGFTIPTSSPNARLDYIFARPGMKDSLTECKVVREPAAAVRQASDHYPVMAEFRF